jgi:serine/threonine protein kinase/Tol biopolymer transport system component
MSNENWSRAKHVFHEALEKAGSERDQFVTDACGDDDTLRKEVERLLTAHDRAGDFLDLRTAGTGAVEQIERPGDRIGPYKLLQLIGEGGFGFVYMAEQEKPIHRRVALKIIKPGMDTKEVIARFETERQALAIMDHPNIAKVLDAGATESGRPYFVMELVKGIALTGYCDTNHLSTRDRLELFVLVAQAVHHAHEKGIIHRDIKPSNVMVTLHDGKPVPKIIDFGVAKATSQRLTEKTLFTAYGACIGTPTYMSPEQAEMSGLEVDRRSDIYSLGVLLYELLTGTTPFSEKELRSAAFVELLRVIREEEPPTPSARLSTLGGDIITVARNRHAEPHVLTKTVRGDLDWIVMKAIEKDRRRRYGSGAELVADITRYFSNQPVMARRPSAWYRTHKLLKRQRVPLAAAAASVAALVVGAALVEFGSVRLFGRADGRNLAAQEDSRQSERGFVARRIAVAPGIESQQFGAPSPDGRYLSEIDYGSLKLQLKELETGETRVLADALPDVTWSTFSPDGSKVAYHRRGDVYVVGADGADDRLLYRSPLPGFSDTRVEAWSPDGTWLLALVQTEHVNRIARIFYPEGRADMVKSFDWRSPSSMSISPRGDYIAYDFAPDRSRPQAGDIFLMPTDWSREIPLVEGPANDTDPVWSPDGMTIVFVSDRGGGKDLWAQDVRDGSPLGAPRLIKSEGSAISPLGFTDDGDFFYQVAKSTGGIDFARYDAEHATLTRVAGPGVQTRGALQINPVWAPDGQKLAYVTRPADGDRLRDGRLMVSFVGDPVDKVFSLDHLAYFNVGGWSADSRRILVSGRKQSGGHEVLWLDLQTGRQEVLFTAPALLRDVTLSPDRTMAYYITFEGPTVARDLETGSVKTLIDNTEFFMRGGIRPSPDGTKLMVGIVEGSLLKGYQRALVITNLADGKTFKLPRPDGDQRAFAWTPDGAYVLAVYGKALWRIPVDGGRPERVQQNLDGLEIDSAIRFDPDGETLTFVHGSATNEIWVLENLQAMLNEKPTL